MNNEVKIFLALAVLAIIYIIYRNFKNKKKVYPTAVIESEMVVVDPQFEETAETTEIDEEIQSIKYTAIEDSFKKSGKEACEAVQTSILTRTYFTDANIKVGVKLYNDLALLFPANCGNKWIKLVRENDLKEFVIKVGTTGNINIIYKCKKTKK